MVKGLGKFGWVSEGELNIQRAGIVTMGRAEEEQPASSSTAERIFSKIVHRSWS